MEILDLSWWIRALRKRFRVGHHLGRLGSSQADLSRRSLLTSFF